jgi:hypothetical protein
MNRRSVRRISLCLVVGLVILGCATPVLVTPPPSTPALEPIETIVVKTAAVAQTQTMTVLPPTTTASITPLPTKTATITPTPTSTVVFLFPTETPWPEDIFDDEETDEETDEEDGNDGYEKPVVVREWDCRVISKSPAKGTVIYGGSTFRAVWTIENTGTKTWPKKGVDIVYHSGAHLEEGRTYYDIPATIGPGGKVTISISMLAPKRSKVYSTRWSLRVGNRDFCDVRFIIDVK